MSRSAVVTPFAEAVEDFLAQKRIAVVGVSRSPDQPANFVFRKLRAAGYDAIPVNPNATEIEGQVCHPDLASIPGGVDGVVVFTHPSATAGVVRACVDLGIRRVWLHRSFGEGSVSESAVEIGRENGLTVVAGGCPAMYCKPVDVGHACIRWALKLTGRLPKTT